MATYTDKIPAEGSGTESMRIATAIRVCLKYTNLPTPDQLIADFGMSRATAYRWRNALRDGGMGGADAQR